MSDKFLFLDFETTGLDVKTTTILEAAWTVTDSRLHQLSPLRSRFCEFSTNGSTPVTPVTPVYVNSSTSRIGWTQQLDQVVVDMHRKSLLAQDWLAAPPWVKLRGNADLDHLIFEDLWSAGWKSEDTLYLAGAGVSHFDRQVLEQIFSRLIASTGSHPRLHYRSADISVARTLLGIPGIRDQEKLIAAVGADPDELGLSTEEGVTDRLTKSGVEGIELPPGNLIVSQLRPHRAADDVAVALVQSRQLRKSVASLTLAG
ncbi:MAG: hypothetical protein WC054_00230 [Candidatus Nanopelagicales bacterium]